MRRPAGLSVTELVADHDLEMSEEPIVDVNPHLLLVDELPYAASLEIPPETPQSTGEVFGLRGLAASEPKKSRRRPEPARARATPLACAAPGGRRTLRRS